MKFIVDRTLGKMAKWLRILGYDTTYWASADLDGLLHKAHDEARILVTKDSRLYRKKGGLRAVHVREDNPFLQLREVVQHFQLPIHDENLFSRCLHCNVPLEEVNRDDVREEVPDYVFHMHQEFSRCPSCRKVYWMGTHHDHMTMVVKRLKEAKP